MGFESEYVTADFYQLVVGWYEYIRLPIYS